MHRFTLRAAVYLVFKKDDKYLMIRRFNTGYRDGEYTMPAGHVDPNETFLTTCVREAKEEVCVTIKPEDLELVHVMQRHEGDVDVVDYYFIVHEWYGTPMIGEPHKCDDLQWFTLDEVGKYGIHFISKAIHNVAEKIAFSYDGVE